MFNRRIKIKPVWGKAGVLFILFLCGFILSANEKAENIGPNCKAVISQSAQTENDSKDVTPNSSSPNTTAVWLMAVDLGHSSIKQANQKNDKSTGFARRCPSKQKFDFTNSENTLGQVNSNLGRRFTLLGEKPSGTS